MKFLTMKQYAKLSAADRECYIHKHGNKLTQQLWPYGPVNRPTSEDRRDNITSVGLGGIVLVLWLAFG